MASNFTMAGIGFFFWTICARLYTPEQIGLATTLISITGLVTSLSMFGFNTAIIRYLPKSKNKNDLINTAFAVVGIAAIVVTSITLIGLPWVTPKLAYIQKYPLFEFSFFVFMVIATLNAITDSVFTAYRKTQYILIINTIMSLVKLILPVVFVGMGMYGIYYSFLTSVNVALIASIIFLTLFFRYRFSPKIYKASFKQLWKFSFIQYIASTIVTISSNIAPLVITSRLGPSITAFFYMPNMIISLFMAIPRSTSNSLFAEGSTSNENLKHQITKMIISSYVLIFPAIMLLLILGDTILLWFGKQYSIEGTEFLKISALSLLITIPNYAFGTVQNIKKENKKILFMSIFSSTISILLLFYLLPLGIKGVAFSSLITQSVTLLTHIVVWTYFNEKSSGFNNNT